MDVDHQDTSSSNKNGTNNKNNSTNNTNNSTNNKDTPQHSKDSKDSKAWLAIQSQLHLLALSCAPLPSSAPSPPHSTTTTSNGHSTTTNTTNNATTTNNTTTIEQPSAASAASAVERVSEPRLVARALRALAALKRLLTPADLHRLINTCTRLSSSFYLSCCSCVEGGQIQADLRDILPPPKEQNEKETETDAGRDERTARSPYIEPYVLLLLHLLLPSPSPSNPSPSYSSTSTLVDAEKLARKTEALLSKPDLPAALDPLLAKLWHAFLLTSAMPSVDRPARLLPLYRAAVLAGRPDTQAVLLLSIVRAHLQSNAIAPASNLIDKVSWPAESMAFSGWSTRWHFYQARVRAIQLDYTAAHVHLQAALRTAPPPSQAPGFFTLATKFALVVQLLMGDMPPSPAFSSPPVLRRPLAPYLALAQAVRVGDLARFAAVLAQPEAQRAFTADGTLSLVTRLRHNVIKTGLRSISLAYSRIALPDVAAKLGLEHATDAQYVVAKAIRDGVITSRLEHLPGASAADQDLHMVTDPAEDSYTTIAPMLALNERIDECAVLYKKALQAMRYPLNAHQADLDTADEARERESKLAHDIESAEGYDEDDDDMMDL